MLVLVFKNLEHENNIFNTSSCSRSGFTDTRVKPLNCRVLENLRFFVTITLYSFQSAIEASGTKAMNFLLRGLLEEGCWVPRQRVIPLYRAGNHFLEAYQFMAYKTLSRGQTHFSMIPKLHMFHHLMEEMEFQSVRAGWAWNCLIDACYQEEDFVGRTSYLTRCVSIRCQVVRTLYRYLAQLNVCWSVK